MSVTCVTTGTCTRLPWSSWSSCSRTCGFGTKTRRRISLTSSASCPALTETESCNTRTCSGLTTPVCQKVKVSGVARHASLNGDYTLHSTKCFNNNVWRKYIGNLDIRNKETNQKIEYFYLYHVQEPGEFERGPIFTWNLGDDLCNVTHVHAYAAAPETSLSPADVTRWFEANDPFDTYPAKRRKRHILEPQSHHITRREADEFVPSSMTVICTDGSTACPILEVSDIQIHPTYNGKYTLHSEQCFNNNAWRRYIGDLGIIDRTTNQTVDFYYIYYVKEPPGSVVSYTWNLGDDLCNATHVDAYAVASSASTSPVDATRWLEADYRLGTAPTKRKKRHLGGRERRAVDFVDSRMSVTCVTTGTCTRLPWSSWSSCSRTCGYGTKTRRRISLTSSASCPALTETESCYTTICSGLTTPGTCTRLPWTSWSNCSRTCGSGTKTRRRSSRASSGSCPDLTDTQTCFTTSCTGAIAPPCTAVTVRGIKADSSLNGVYKLYTGRKCTNKNVYRHYVSENIVDRETKRRVDYFYLYFIKEPPASPIGYTWNLGVDLCNGTHVMAYVGANFASTSPDLTSGDWYEGTSSFSWQSSYQRSMTIRKKRGTSVMSSEHHVSRREADDFARSAMTVTCSSRTLPQTGSATMPGPANTMSVLVCLVMAFMPLLI